MDALILVDIQNDFLPGGALAVPRGDEVIPIANALSARAPLVVATQDWHPAGHRSFARNNPGRRVGELIELDGLPQVLWPDHCVQGSRGAELAPGLDRSRIAAVFPKGEDPAVDSYSGFYDNGRRRATGLARWLRSRGVDRVFVMGLATDYCVAATTIDAVAEGFDAHVVSDGCRGVELSAGDCARAEERMSNAGARSVRSGEVSFRR
ncbi:MAG TPA: bifunctional nicotinamidase/pyrazinamidase [Phycisphaerales bacterium]|nr:bifunctional nicotinamidase/pyrazinamidase [Phycisphaerales bacterium]